MARTVIRINLFYVFIAIIVLWVGAVMVSDRVSRSKSNTAGQSQTKTDSLSANGTNAQTLSNSGGAATQKTPSNPSGYSSLPKSSKPFFQSTCTKTSIPYTTEYKTSANMYTDQSTTIPGRDGILETCTADSNGYKPADYVYTTMYPKVVTTGTKPRPAPQPTGISYESAYSSCQAQVGASSSAFEQCMHAYGY